MPEAASTSGVTERIYYRWKKKQGGLGMHQAKRLKDLEKENAGRDRRPDGSILGATDLTE